jgi:glycosyltransferase involved in cell wall biosynthesis
MHPPSVSIVVPVFDEEESLPKLAEQIRHVCDGAGMSFEVWFVDDGSRDASWPAIVRLHSEDERFAGIRLRRNYGKSAALSAGFEAARGQYVVTMDADLQDDPEEIPALIAMLESGLDLVSGWKKERHDPLSKTIPSRFFNTVTRKLSGIPLHDFNCGLKAYRADVVKNLHVYGEMHRYIPLLAKWEGHHRIGEKVVRHRAREFGRTKFGLERFIRGFLDLISVIFLTRFAARPMHFFGTAGSIAFVLGFLVSAYLSVDKLVFDNPIGNRPLFFLGVLLLLLGAQMFSTGLIGEMLLQGRMERRDRLGTHVRQVVAPEIPDSTSFR